MSRAGARKERREISHQVYFPAFFLAHMGRKPRREQGKLARGQSGSREKPKVAHMGRKPRREQGKLARGQSGSREKPKVAHMGRKPRREQGKLA